jgi:hypothetical protein
MGIRLRPDGTIFKAWVKDKVLHVEFMPGLEITYPVPFVKEDFLISHTWQQSNVCLLIESTSGMLMVGWFTGSIKLLKQCGERYRYMAFSAFNIQELIDANLTVINAGCVKREKGLKVTRTNIYPLTNYMIKGNDNYIILDTCDKCDGFVLDTSLNKRFIEELAFAVHDYPGYLRVPGNLQIIGDDWHTLVQPYVIEQPVDMYSFNL